MIGSAGNCARAWEWVRAHPAIPNLISTADLLHLHALTIGDLLPAERSG
ncbi:MAG: hypothetical protein VB080_14165 [Propionicimonas sp.]|nr:hypothetical protein [Propionicimonas sp.]MEA4945567.1 hypothetical protein [Propionicimonas sp.]MEA5053336.1 hypothetical protein [Propionicimonas sp.]